MKKVWVKVVTVVSTYQLMEIDDDTNVKSEEFHNEVLGMEKITNALFENTPDCIEENAMVTLVEDENGVLYDNQFI